jgi:hypothetical protein
MSVPESVSISYEQIPALTAGVREFSLAHPEFCAPPPLYSMMQAYADAILHSCNVDRARAGIAARRESRIAAVDLATGRRSWTENCYKWWQ